MAKINASKLVTIMLDHGKKFTYTPGVHSNVPDEIANHWYARENGVTVIGQDDAPAEDEAATGQGREAAYRADQARQKSEADEASRLAREQALKTSRAVEAGRKAPGSSQEPLAPLSAVLAADAAKPATGVQGASTAAPSPELNPRHDGGVAVPETENGGRPRTTDGDQAGGPDADADTIETEDDKAEDAKLEGEGVSKADLVAKATALGVSVKSGWGMGRLRKEIAAKEATRQG